ncbi:MAG: hypothetical protein ACJAW3_000264 [Lentimonas sp.]|jgi:hypothetical protein
MNYEESGELHRIIQKLRANNKRKCSLSIEKKASMGLSEKYVKEKNPDGELIWVDRYVKFKRFRINQAREEVGDVVKNLLP